MNTPKISIITINFNDREGLERTCQSIAEQKVRPYEWIVIDGGSTDGSIDVIKQYEDCISYWVSEPDNGIYDAFNKGVKVSSGDFINFINSGDCLAGPNVIEQLSFEFENTGKEYDYVVGRTMLDGDPLRLLIPPQEVTATFLFQSYLSCPSTLFGSSLFDQIQFNQDFRIVGDWVFSVESLLLHNAKYKSIDLVVADYDTHGISMTQKWDAFIERESAWKHFFGERVYEDFVRLTSGKTTLEKIVCRVAQYKGLYKLLTIVALPVFALYKIRKRF